jgi:hypothetical protein
MLQYFCRTFAPPELPPYFDSAGRPSVSNQAVTQLGAQRSGSG